MTPSTPPLDPHIARSLPYLEYLYDWAARLPDSTLQTVIEEAGGPTHVAIVSVDLIKGFTRVGPLSGARVAALVPRVAHLLEQAHGLGIAHLLFVQDAHPPDSPEFDDLPAHCVKGTEEAEMDEVLSALSFASQFTIIEKTSLDALVDTPLEAWLEAHPEVRRLVVVGDCTDLCVYALVMHLQMRAHTGRRDYEVVVPAACVETYDLPVDVAQRVGARPHDGDLLHRVFLHQMAANGVKVVGRLGG